MKEAGIRVRTVLFDAVGTLIRPYPSVGSVYSRAAAAHGVRCGARALDAHFRKAYRELMPERFAGGELLRTSESRERRWWKRAVARTFERAGCGPLPRGVVEAVFEAFAEAEAWRPYADALRVLERLGELGVRLGVVSNFDSRLHAVLEGLNLKGRFSSVIISSECGFAKPSPRIFRAALRDLGAAGEETLFVGDRLLQDYRGPRGAGIRACRLVRDGSRRGPHVIRSLERLPAFLLPPPRSTSTRLRPAAPAGPLRR
jgi:putative hydrolase of the HAD superfamily